jgi:hypothetical protein
MFGTYFYHKKIRTAVAIFGTLFNNLYVIRKNTANTQVLTQQKVPLSYAPQSKFLARIQQNPNLYEDTPFAIKLPRMSFEMLSITYDATRQLQKNNNFTQSGTSILNRNKFNSFVPYILTFQLSIYAKNQDDALQLVEQILPYFAPQYTLAIKPFEDYPNVSEDIPIILQSVDFSDDYEGAQENRRTIIYTLTFDMKINFYGPINTGGIIRTSKPTIAFFEGDSDIPLSEISVTPNPADASPDSDYGFTTTIIEKDEP